MTVTETRNGNSATSQIITRLRNGEELNSQEVAEEYGVSVGLLGVTVTGLRGKGWVIENDAGRYRVESIPEEVDDEPPVVLSDPPVSIVGRIRAVFESHPDVELSLDQIAELAGLTLQKAQANTHHVARDPRVTRLARGRYIFRSKPFQTNGKGNGPSLAERVAKWFMDESGGREATAEHVAERLNEDQRRVANSIQAIIAGKCRAELNGLVKGDNRGTYRWVGADRAHPKGRSARRAKASQAIVPTEREQANHRFAQPNPNQYDGHGLPVVLPQVGDWCQVLMQRFDDETGMLGLVMKIGSRTLSLEVLAVQEVPGA